MHRPVHKPFLPIATNPALIYTYTKGGSLIEGLCYLGTPIVLTVMYIWSLIAQAHGG